MDTRMEREGPKTGQAARDVGENIRSGAAEMVEAGKEAGRKLGAALESARDNIREKTVSGMKATDRAIRGNPYGSIGIAFGVGLLIGVLINRNR